ncbi:MAG: cytochrome c biogenesis protein ResB [Limisphaerales bacterium]
MRALIHRLIKVLTSLRLTVALLAFAIVIVFIGTLAQVDEGLYNAQARYFRQWIIFGADFFGHKIPLIFPGGYLIGTLLLANLLSAHIYRFQLSVKKLGIQLAHSGIILLLVGQLATDMMAHESQMRLTEGETKSYGESAQNFELAFISQPDPRTRRVVSLPARLLANGGEIQDPSLPFTIRVLQYWKNSQPNFRAPMVTNGPPLTPNGVAQNFDFQPVAEAKSMDDRNVPTAILEFSGANGSLGQWVVSDWTADGDLDADLQQDYNQEVGAEMARVIIGDLIQPQSIIVGGTNYQFELRPVRYNFPFSLTLLKATHTVYQGTDIPKDFRSLVRLRNPATGEDRQVQIYMNAPLRYDGLTFYQYQMDAGQVAADAGHTPSSVLQVVHNPGWLTPYVGCAMVGLGLVIQFMYHLVGFISKRK